MIKVAVLDDYQDAFRQIIDVEKFQGKFEFKVFVEPFENENEVILRTFPQEFSNLPYQEIFEVLAQANIKEHVYKQLISESSIYRLIEKIGVTPLIEGKIIKLLKLGELI